MRHEIQNDLKKLTECCGSSWKGALQKRIGKFSVHGFVLFSTWEAQKNLYWKKNDDNSAKKYCDFLFDELRENVPDTALSPDYFYDYCSSFVMYCLYYSGYHMQEWEPPYSKQKLPRTSVYGLFQYFKKYEHVEKISANQENIKPGDIIFFRWTKKNHSRHAKHHCGIVVSLSDKEMTTAEGNTNKTRKTQLRTRSRKDYPGTYLARVITSDVERYNEP